MIVAGVLAQLAVAVSAPDTVAACEPATIVVTTEAAGTVSPRVLIPDLSPFDLVRATALPRLVRDSAGEYVTVTEHRYQLSTPRTGAFTVGAFEARYDGARARSEPVRIVVRPTGGASTPPILARGRGPDAPAIDFRAIAVPETLYVGEQLTYQAAAFVDDSIQSRLRRNPEFFPPEMRGMLSYELPFLQGYVAQRDGVGRCAEVPVYQRALFPLSAGRHVIPPATLLFTMPRPFGFFSREDNVELRSDSLVVIVREPPFDGRPAGWHGAVGDLSVEARVDTTIGRAGEPLLVTVAVTGVGNVKLFPRPELSLRWGAAIADGDRVRVDSQTPIRGTKEFDWIVTPRVDGEVELPSVRYPYFDPTSGSYRVAETAPIILEIAPGHLLANDDRSRAATLPLRREWRGERPPSPVASRYFWGALLAAPFPALLVTWARRPRHPRAPRSLPPGERLRRLSRGPTARDARAVRRAFAAALAERLALPPEPLTRSGAVVRALRRAGVSSEVAAEAERLLHDLDAAAYGRRVRLSNDGAARAVEIFRKVDREARSRAALVDCAARARRRRPPRGLGLVVLASLGLGAASLAAAPEDAPARFARGVELYESRRFVAAAHTFRALAADAPRAADAWANFGTAAWAVGDSARAALGWHRALRLEPRAGDMRERLALLPPAASEGPGEVSLIEVETLTLAAGILWLLGWLAAAVPPQRVGSWRTFLVRGGLTTALLSGAAAANLAVTSDPRRLAIVTRTEPLRAVPALSADDVSAVASGEVVRLVAEQGAWVRVATEGDREGWIERARLVALAGARRAD